jgi:hypothetical protein
MQSSVPLRTNVALLKTNAGAVLFHPHAEQQRHVPHPYLHPLSGAAGKHSTIHIEII